jgi:ribose-phosphate pyrophosphokinase
MIKVNNYVVETIDFPNMEIGIKKNVCTLATDINVWVEWIFDDKGVSEMFVLKCIVDYLHSKECRIILRIPYFPFSRMDRASDSFLFSLKSFADFINSLKAVRVEILEPHSDVTPALINNVSVKYFAPVFINNIIVGGFGIIGEYEHLSNVYLCFPDVGAQKRYTEIIPKEDLAKFGGVITFNKHRDFKTGKIESIKTTDPVPQGCKVIIVDDLCSFGGTFLAAGNELKRLGASSVYLAVAHLEKNVFNGKLLDDDSPIERIITTHSIGHNTCGDIPKNSKGDVRIAAYTVGNFF